MVLLFVRSYRSSRISTVVGLGRHILSDAPPTNWNCHSSVIALPATSSTRIRSSFDPGGNPQHKSGELYEDDSSKPPGPWKESKLDKSGQSRRCMPAVLEKSGKISWLQNQGKPAGDNSRSPGGEIQILCEEGQLDKALDALVLMEREGIVPSDHTYSSLLKSCVKRKALVQARRVQANLSQNGLDSTSFLGSCLVSTLVKCGSVEDAREAFEKLTQRTVFSWTAIISGYSTAGQGQEALRLYRCMREEGVEPDKYTFVTLLRACGSLSDLEEGKRIHAEVLKFRCESDLFVGSCLVDMYGRCGSIVEAQNVFDRLRQRNEVSWTAMIAAYTKHRQADKALQLYEQMREEGVSPDNRTFLIALQACGLLAEMEIGVVVDGPWMKVKSLEKGKAIHAASQNKGFDSDVFIGNTLINMYTKCGSVVDAQRVFDELYQRTVVSWNAILLAYLQQGLGDKVLQLYQQMQEDGVSPNMQTLICLLQFYGIVAEKEDGAVVDEQFTKVKSLQKLKAMHIDVQKRRYDSDLFVVSTLISTYAKCGSIMEARYVFDGLSHRDVVSWNSMLAAYAQYGQAEKALQLYEQMRSENVSSNSRTFVSVLQACGVLAEKDKQMIKFKFLEKGKVIHAEVQKKGYESDVFIGNTLVSMYGKCGSIVDAQNIFDSMSDRSVVAWTAMLAAYVQQGKAEKALQLYDQMWEEGVSPNNRTLVSALEACGMLAERERENVVHGQLTKLTVLEQGKMIHAHAQMKGYDADGFVASTLISMYGKCSSIKDAQDVFDSLSHHDVVLWNVMLAAYVQQGQADKALKLYAQMHVEGMEPNDRTFVSVLQACGMLAEKQEDTGNGVSPKEKTLEWGRAVHSDAQKNGYDSDVFVGNTLITMYGKCGSIVDARRVFNELLQRNVVSWNAMIAAYAENGLEGKALQLYRQMQDEGVSWDDRTFVSVLQACGMLAEKEYVEDGNAIKAESLTYGRAIHADAQSKGYDSDVFVCNTLISMYGKCRSIVDAEAVFDTLSLRPLSGSHSNVAMPHSKNTVQPMAISLPAVSLLTNSSSLVAKSSMVSWNVMLAAYVEQGLAEKALQLYRKMQEGGVSPDRQTFLSTLQACGLLAEKEGGVNESSTRLQFLEMGKAIHADARKKGYHSDVFIGSTLISMYRKCGSIMDAQKAFDELPHQNVVSWTAMLVAYAQQDQGDKVLQLYKQMQQEGVIPDDITMGCILQSCSDKGGLDICREIHQTATSDGNNLSALLATTLIHAYGKCASMVDAQTVFDSLSQPDVVSWSALIAGYARDGNLLASLQNYEEMQQRGIKPDAVTFLSLLSACSHAGLVDKGVEFFESMSKDHGITPGIEHYVAMVDLLGRAGYLDRVEHLLSTMPMEPDLAMWLCLLGACRKHGSVELGKRAFDGAVSLRPQESAAYMLMLNIYTDAGLWDCAKELKELRQRAGAWKKPGQSWIENEQGVHTFLVKDCKHPKQEQLYDFLGTVSLELEEGTIPRKDSIL